MFFTYILYSAYLNKYYTGYCSNLDKRLNDHNCGISKYTSRANDWILVHSETYSTREEAHSRERDIKRKKSRKYIEFLLKKGN